MNLRQLHLFRLIYETGSIVRAAEHERCAPSVLAHHLANLEARLGTPLFDRTARGAMPTEQGERLYSHALGILRSVELAEQDVRDSGDSPSGSIEIGLAFSAVLAIGAPLLQRFFDRAPDLRLTIAESLSGGTIDRLLSSEVDMALAYSPSRDARLRLTPLLEEGLMCIGHRDLVGDPDSPLSFGEFLKMPFILPKSGSNGRPALDNLLRQKALEDHARLFTQNVQVCWIFLREKMGVMLAPELYLRHGLAGSEAVGRKLEAPEVSRTLYLCERKDMPPSKALDFAKEHLTSVVRDAVSSGEWPARCLAAEG